MQFPELKYNFDYKTVLLDNNISIAYLDEGKGENTLLFVHGLSSYIKAWTENIEVLKNYFRCIAIDLPGYGKSAAGVFSGSMIFYAEVIKLFIEKLNLQNVILCGHSMGGQISISTVLNFPQLIEKLILVAPAGFEVFNEEEIKWIKNFFKPETTLNASEEQIRFNYKLNFENMPDSVEEMIQDRLDMRNWKNFRNYAQVVSNSLSGMLDYPVYDRLNQINIPTLILFGYQDKFIPNPFLHKNLKTEEIARDGASKIKNSKLVLLENCGHFIQLDKKDEFNQNIINNFYHNNF